MEERLFEVVEQYGEKQAVVAKYMNLETALEWVLHRLAVKRARLNVFGE